MTEGLPLASLEVPHQGLLASGLILPAFGNWIGTEITLDLNLPGGGKEDTKLGSPNRPVNLVHNWPANTPLSQTLKQTLQTAFPKMKLNIQISDNLKLSYNDVGFYNSLAQYANYIQAISMSILGKQKGYNGIKTTVKNNAITMMDTTATTDTISIDYWDLIGQPTWVGANTIQVKTVLRGDIDTTNKIKLPQTLMSIANPNQILGGGGINNISNVSNANTLYQVIAVRHNGKFRQNDGYSWCTTIDASVQQGS